jgi:hypothetical protein
MRTTIRIVTFMLLTTAAAVCMAGETATLVACAPGYPGSTEQAQPTMDAFAAQSAKLAGWDADALAAIYYKSLDAGLERLEQPDAALAFVPLPFFLEYSGSLGLVPVLQGIDAERPTETWTLVAAKGKVSGPGSLDGWQVAGRGGYSPAFVRGVALQGWGTLPDTAEVTFTSRAVSALRKASRGEPVAVLLDGEQSAALDGLPFAADLEPVYTSEPLPGSVLCVVGDRLDAGRTEGLRAALLRLGDKKTGREILDELRLARFAPVDEEGLERARELWNQSIGP